MAMPKRLTAVIVLLITLSLVPLAFIALARVSFSTLPRIEIVPDMDEQQKFKPQSVNTMFADGRAMRPEIDGTVAYHGAKLDDHYYRGVENGGWATTFPSQLRVDKPFIERGRSRYNIYCAVCHGDSGYGNGMVAVRVDELQQGTWTPPSNLHDENVRNRPVGHIFNTITNGIRNMPAYAPQIPVSDRWAIVAYVRALQRSGHASLADIPEDMRQALLDKAGIASVDDAG
jgi:mono/diheme cytochrome c family protein